MSSERLPNGAPGLLRGQRTRSYGSIVNSSLSPVRQKRIEHEVQPGETLQGLSLKYGVSMEEIKRANRLYTNDSIFLKKSLSIPVLSALDSGLFGNGEELSDEEMSPEHCTVKQEDTVKKGTARRESSQDSDTSDLSPTDYLKRMDCLISQSKEAAAKTCGEDRGFAAEDPYRTSRRSRSQVLSYRGRPSPSHERPSQTIMGAVPLTITKRTQTLREREDEIFQL